MSVTYKIDKALRTVYLNYTGHPAFDEWAETMRSAFRDPGFEPGFSFIMDRRLVTAAPKTDYIDRIVAFIKDHPVELGQSNVAIVVTGLGSYGMARMSQSLLEDTTRTRIFTTIEEAERWLRSQKPEKGVWPPASMENQAESDK